MRTFVQALFVAAALAIPLAGFARAEQAHAGHKGADGKSATGVIGLDVYVDGGRLHLLTTRRTSAGAKPAMAYARSDDDGETWSAPVPVGSGQPTPDPAKRGLDPQIAASGDRLVAVWTTGAESRFGRGPLATAISRDGGRTWAPGPNPADDGLATDHAFADVAADDAGTFHAVWLDGRAGGPNPGKGLRYAKSADGGATWSANATLDASCCECCWNSLLALPGGRMHVLFRDKDPRDMALTSSLDAGKSWSNPVTVGTFDWDFTGCPHVGGALAAGDVAGKNLHAVVWTAKGGDTVGAFALSARDGGRTWSRPARLGGPQSSRPDVAADHAGRVVAVWDEYVEDESGSGNAAFAAESIDGGATWSSPQKLSDPRASATYPRVVRMAEGFRVFWTQKKAGEAGTWASRTLD